MANDLTSTPHLFVLDSTGIVSESMLVVSKIIYVPDAVDDDLLFKQWNETSTVAAGSLSNKTGTITATKTLTSTGNLPSTIADGHIFELTVSSGEADNLGKKLVETAGNNNAITITEDDWTDEASKVYCWKTYATTTAVVLKAGPSDVSPIHLDFGPSGRVFPNLALETIDGGTAYVYMRIT